MAVGVEAPVDGGEAQSAQHSPLGGLRGSAVSERALRPFPALNTADVDGLRSLRPFPSSSPVLLSSPRPTPHCTGGLRWRPDECCGAATQRLLERLPTAEDSSRPPPTAMISAHYDSTDEDDPVDGDSTVTSPTPLPTLTAPTSLHPHHHCCHSSVRPHLRPHRGRGSRWHHSAPPRPTLSSHHPSPHSSTQRLFLLSLPLLQLLLPLSQVSLSRLLPSLLLPPLRCLSQGRHLLQW